MIEHTSRNDREHRGTDGSRLRKPRTAREIREQAAANKLEQQIAEQRKWIKDRGDTLAGYIARYGSAQDPKHYGDGGEAIYKADTDTLANLIAQR